tara:strand:- start:109 stop:276 length:168 start_codon:yes stop_codon:yes gene_type:complete
VKQIKSPCTGICTIDEDDDLCIGCLRKTKEIVDWKSMTINEKNNILKKIMERKNS